MTAKNRTDKIWKAVFAAAAIVCTVCVVAIFAFLIIRSAPAFAKIGFFNFLFGDKWIPDSSGTYADPRGTYGIFTMVVGTLAATAGALAIGGTLGYFTAVFLAFYCPKGIKRILSSVINLLAGIPSVVYGFFGIVFLLPKLALIAPNNGSGLLATSIILGIMILPTVVSLSRTSLEAVPKAYYEGSVATGATHSETVFRIMSPAAKSGITASLVLGIGRALGETMAVIMVAGNSAAYPEGLFSSFRVMTANIALEMGYAGELQEGALIATGVVLLLFVLLVNLLFGAISGKAVKAVTTSKKRFRPRMPKIFASKFSSVKEFFRAAGYRLKTPLIGKILSFASGLAASFSLLLVIGFILAKGLPYLVKNPSLIYGEYVFASKKITILPAIVTTLWAVVLGLLISVPIGIMTAIFLNEYTDRKNVFVKIIRTSIDVLSGVPSIVFGLFGMITFVKWIKGSNTILAGVLTISMMLLPTIVRSVEESLKSVQDGLREGSYALGASKTRTIFKIVLPSAMPGILSAIILTMGRIISESAPLLYTMGSMIASVPKDVFDHGATLAVALYQLSGEGWYMNEAYATAVVLIVIVLALNLLAELLASRLNKKLGGSRNGKK
ncbi:MAG: phosphate ABC transporter permease subunit PstC [Candidatus Borkfalkiaceae bacterium]|nr:phosphate ABC transporter permease subunit PstC [Christensenellaceae bacterium]